MTAHYGVTLISAANKNAINVVLALWVGDNPAVSQNVSQPANQSGDIGDAATYWFWRSSLRRRRTLGNSEFARQYASCDLACAGGGWASQ
ncbi:hypothetical protein ACVWZK_008343 [Bradyrhizobium sp. GM0.4]